MERGDQGTGIRVRLCSDKSQCLGTISAVSVLHQDTTQPAGSGIRVLPAPKKGVWDGSMLEAAQGVYCRSTQRDQSSQEHREHGEPYLGARSTTRTRGTWQGLGDKSTISDTALAERPSQFSCKIGKNSPWQRFPVFPIPSPAQRICWVLFQGAGAAQNSSKQLLPLDQLFLEILVDLELPFLPVRRQERFPFLCFNAKTSLKSTIKQTKSSSWNNPEVFGKRKCWRTTVTRCGRQIQLFSSHHG